MDLQKFIHSIEELVDSKKPNQIIKYVKNLNGFINSLKSLNSMIGMNDLKNNIVSQIKYYFVNQFRLSKLENPPKELQMFHTVLLGPPGCGKTTAAEILANIWMNLGVLKQENNKIIPSKEFMLDIPIPNLNFLNQEKEKLKKCIEDCSKEAFDSKVRLCAIKTELFFEKEKLSDLSTILTNNKQDIDSILYQTINNKINSLDSGYEHIIKKYIGSDNRKIPNANEIETIEEETNIKESSNFIKLRRDDLIGKYVGHTAIKTREALMAGLGKVIFIDEAYELYNVTSDTSSDSFGMECLSSILNFMNEFSDRTIIIFAGYEDLLKKTIFRVQPGLERRIAWTFTLNPYNENELVQIYEKQLQEKSWILENKDKIINLFKINKEFFKHGGGDTLRLATYTKTVYSNICFERLLQNQEISSTINYDIVLKAIEVLKDTNLQKKDSKPPEGMYS
jgi:SpoVK/Ycf46/Vps4 family AAA+-type ATPase